jgi:hypothetical protein
LDDAPPAELRGEQEQPWQPPSASDRRLASRHRDLQLVQRATPAINEIRTSLNWLLVREMRAAERLRMLREATNRITRTANDAIQAYRRVKATLAVEIERPDGNRDRARSMLGQLHAARSEMLATLEEASRQYGLGETAIAEPPPPGSDPARGRDASTDQDT